MQETVAVTGVVEGTNFDECDNCHYGSEVDFSIYMERSASGNKTVTTAIDNGNNSGGDYNGYVGGSSAATATMAGIAAIAWANDPDLSRDQLLNRLIQTSSSYPDKDNNFGWGAINACEAVDTTYKLPCASKLSNQVTMEITKITFPSTDDGFGSTAEWVLKLDGQSYYFEVPEGGASGNPSLYNNESVCDAAPVLLDLGISICGDTSLTVLVETHEDDGVSSECSFDFGDDDQTISTETVGFGSGSFSQSTSNGLFVFEYVLYCEPQLIAVLSDDSPKCPGDSLQLPLQVKISMSFSGMQMTMAYWK